MVVMIILLHLLIRQIFVIYKNELQNSKAMENKKDCKNMRLINIASYLKKQYRYRFRFI